MTKTRRNQHNEFKLPAKDAAHGLERFQEGLKQVMTVTKPQLDKQVQEAKELRRLRKKVPSAKLPTTAHK